MRVYFLIGLLCVVNVESQFWDNNFLPNWFRVAKSANNRNATTSSIIPESTKITTTSRSNETTTVTTQRNADSTTTRIRNNSTTGASKIDTDGIPTKVRNVIPVSTTPVPITTEKSTNVYTTSTLNDGTTFDDTTILDLVTTEESRDISRTHEFYLSKRTKPQIKVASNISQVSVVFLLFNVLTLMVSE